MRRLLPSITNCALSILALALLTVAAPMTAHAQSLGDIARQQRADKQSTKPARVYTNDDFESPEAPVVTDKSAQADSDSTDANAQPAAADAKAGDTKPADAKPEDAAKAADKADSAADKKPSKKNAAADATNNEGDEKAAKAEETEASKDAKQKAQREKDIVERTKEVNDRYINRIKKLREDLNQARLQLAKTQSDQVESTRAYHNTAGMTPTPIQYDAEQRDFIVKIAEQQDLIKGLEQQLSDAQEAARHAGVPRPYDY